MFHPGYFCAACGGAHSAIEPHARLVAWREQVAQQMQFGLQRERQEAERKRIEAQGVSDFQRIVSTGISEALLEWKGIEATEKLVNSPNSKSVVIGNPKNGLPLILPSQ